jgi:hypothetical protein
MKAIIFLNGKPDHKDPYPYVYCVRLAFKLDPEGKHIEVRKVPA